MSEQPVHNKTPEDIERSLARARAKLAEHGVTRDPRSRRATEHKQRKGIGDRRELRATGRTALLTFRCREGLHDEVMKAAKAEGLKLAEWMERVLEAAIADQNKEDNDA
jgi:hypothetical protein